MATGLPVVAARGGAVPEVAGDAALLLEPGDADGFAREIRRTLNAPALAERMRRDGHAQAARFRWSTTAAETLAVYREAAAVRAKARSPS
jgi:glycosyltransferase involved in cell wall biosynthesis